MLNIPKISLGSVHKSYTHDLSFDNNTTARIGFVQPLLSHFLSPNDAVSLSLKQLVRLAPMPVPTFARMSVVNKAYFVPMVDVYKAWESLLSQTRVTPYGHAPYIPQSVPLISNRELVALLCALDDTKVTLLLGTDASKLKPTSSDSASSILQSQYFSDVTGVTFFSKGVSDITPDASDFILVRDSRNYALVQLGRKGRIARTALTGLGYGLSINDNKRVSVLPILAFYKAYFDAYEPLRDRIWSTTYAYRFIDACFESGLTTSTSISSQGTALFSYFFNEFAQLFATYNDDYLSIHRITPNIGNLPTVSNSVATQYTSLTDQMQSYDTDGNIITASVDTNADPPKNYLTLLSLQTLQRIQRYVNKDSIIGHKVAAWLRTHFGESVVSDYFKESNHIADIITPCDIDDIYSNSDTIQSDGSGDYLGAFAGKGIGFNKSGFRFKAVQHGYLFVMSAVIPRSSVYQGNDPTLYAVDRYTYPSADFDALGFELTPYNVFSSDGGLQAQPSSDSTKGFGFVPRFTGFKVKKDIVNGDLSRRPTRPYLSCYHLERQFTTPAFDAILNSDGTYNVSLPNSVSIPQASQDYRFINKFGFLGNYDRIFYDSGDNAIPPTSSSFKGDLVDDQFIIQTVFDFKVTNTLKPISQSFDTFEDTTDNTTTSVNAE